MSRKVSQRFVGLNFNVHQKVFIISGGLLAPLEPKVYSIRAGKTQFPSSQLAASSETHPEVGISSETMNFKKAALCIDAE